ncbi:MAG: peptide chain release factor 1 [Phototrophicaceae bacterium]|jgi:peptide chain release factor 1
MIDKLAGIESRYNELDRLLSDPAVWSDSDLLTKYKKEQANLEEMVAAFRVYRSKLDALEQAKDILYNEKDKDLREMAELEVSELETELPTLEDELRVMLLPKDARDDKNVIMEIRGGAGGDEAGLFAADLYRMYTRYAEANRFKFEILSQNESGIGGFSQVQLKITGKGAYSRYKYESGVHRVQRVPATESQGRIHTSTVTVAVLAELEDVDVDVNPNDVRLDVFRSGGAGGQSVNTTDSAVRLTHIPSGIVVEMQDERSQLQNRERAWQILRNRLYEIEVERQRSEQDAERRSQVGTGDRSEKIRTYNYPQNRVTDHRINYSSYNLTGVMEGAIDDFINELATREEADRLSAVGTEDED